MSTRDAENFKLLLIHGGTWRGTENGLDCLWSAEGRGEPYTV